MTTGNKKYIRLLFVGIIPLLFFQFYISWNYSEPFPAIMMPRFTYQEINNDTISFPKVEIRLIFKDSSIAVLDKHDFFAKIHLPQRNKILRRVFSVESDKDAGESLNLWLRNRSAALTGRNNIDRIEFHWHSVYWIFGDMHQPVKQEYLGEKVFKFFERN